MGASRPQWGHMGRSTGRQGWSWRGARQARCWRRGTPPTTLSVPAPRCRARRRLMVDKVKKVWLDGQFIDWDTAQVPILTHSLHYGLAVFDGMRAYKRADGGTYVFRLREHVDRLFDSAKMCFLKPEVTREQVMKASIEALRINEMPDG